ncbi:MAG: hypothetical protein ACOY3P_01470 [Planctomycetota bacterium]
MVWQHLLSQWIRSTAQQKAQEALFRAMEGQQRGPKQESGPAATCDDAPSVCHLGLVFALGIEAGGFEDLLEGVVRIRAGDFAILEGGIQGKRIAVALSGAGAAAAVGATESLIAGHRPQRIVSAGFAGALTPQLKRFDVILADRVVSASGGELPVDVSAVSGDMRSKVHVGPLLTAERVARTPAEKRSLGERFGALAVDLETFAVAEHCRRMSLPFLAARAISDGVDDELPHDVEKLLAQRSAASQFGAALGAVLKRPSSALDLYQLKENALVASDRLAKFLAELCARLP